MKTVWRITNDHKGEVVYMEKKPHVRRYMMENVQPGKIKVEEIQWQYKYQLVKILNETLKIGYLQGCPKGEANG